MKKHSVMRWAVAFTSLTPMFVAFNISAAVPQKVSMFPEGERLVYTRLVEAYHRGQLSEVAKQRQTLERNYPRSIHLDNAYYLSGMAELQNNRLGEAIKTFDVVRDRFVKSNKRPSAMFAIAATYQKLNLPVQAHRAFQKIMSEYPGSPESQRAWMQLRVEKEIAKPSLKR
ncbi:MAG: tetratricopeptide repeat protein [Bdellovibrionales bacterium]